MGRERSLGALAKVCTRLDRGSAFRSPKTQTHPALTRTATSSATCLSMSLCSSPPPHPKCHLPPAPCPHPTFRSSPPRPLTRPATSSATLFWSRLSPSPSHPHPAPPAFCPRPQPRTQPAPHLHCDLLRHVPLHELALHVIQRRLQVLTRERAAARHPERQLVDEAAKHAAGLGRSRAVGGGGRLHNSGGCKG